MEILETRRTKHALNVCFKTSSLIIFAFCKLSEDCKISCRKFVIYDSCSNLTSFSAVEGKSANSLGLFFLFYSLCCCIAG